MASVTTRPQSLTANSDSVGQRHSNPVLKVRQAPLARQIIGVAQPKNIYVSVTALFADVGRLCQKIHISTWCRDQTDSPHFYAFIKFMKLNLVESHLNSRPATYLPGGAFRQAGNCVGQLPVLGAWTLHWAGTRPGVQITGAGKTFRPPSRRGS